MAARAATRVFANAVVRSKIASRPSHTFSHAFRQLAPSPTCIRVSGTTTKPTFIPALRCFSSEAQQQYRTLSFYKFSPIDKNSLKELREELLKDLHAMGIVGRIYIASEGINAQMSCPEKHLPQLKMYLQTKLKSLFGELMDVNLGTEHSRSFRALHVRIRKQLVSDGMKEGTYDLSLQPSHLHPKDWHAKLEKARASGKNPILIDMRNHYESQIGYFEGAIKPDVETFKGSMKAMNEIVKDLPKDQEVYMYCTGGIRCSKAGAILRSAGGFETVHMVAGGVTAYGRWVQAQEDKMRSLFRGKNFTFDARLGERISDEVLSQCHICGQTCDSFTNCVNASCNLLLVACSNCRARFKHTCGRPECYKVVEDYYDQGVGRSFKKLGDYSERTVVGVGASCEHPHDTRIRASQVLGEPGDVMKKWEQLGIELPPLNTPV
ncbi:hypothetical protein INT44_001627 [Umbelopsis vinacea]|uniref:Rhodanese domain-containing protein n=1 Tax=Umbelopsis vinacea TaxID=44442 RepID=A0A8H7UD16_9FUNG|nr:hypothetical protein INT44_001627 [Umbelopsis vinacea]